MKLNERYPFPTPQHDPQFFDVAKVANQGGRDGTCSNDVILIMNSEGACVMTGGVGGVRKDVDPT
jgi:hypothetical protein